MHLELGLEVRRECMKWWAMRVFPVPVGAVVKRVKGEGSMESP